MQIKSTLFQTFIILGIFAGFAAGCASVSTLQTARTLPKGDTRAFVGGGTYGGSAYSGNDNLASVTKALAEAGVRAGIMDRLDAGARVTLPGTLFLDGKYQFLDAGPIALASGLGFGYTSLKTSGGTTESSFTIIDLVAPIYASYDFNETFAVYASPKYMARFASGTDVKSSSSSLVAGTLGLKMGQTVGVMLEGSVLKGIGSNSAFSATQLNGVFFWNSEVLSFLK